MHHPEMKKARMHKILMIIWAQMHNIFYLGSAWKMRRFIASWSGSGSLTQIKMLWICAFFMQRPDKRCYESAPFLSSAQTKMLCIQFFALLSQSVARSFQLEVQMAKTPTLKIVLIWKVKLVLIYIKILIVCHRHMQAWKQGIAI